MTRLLHQLGLACARHPWRVVAGWLAAIGIVTALSSLAGGEFRDMATVPGTPSDQAIERLRTSFPAEAGASAHVVAKTNGVSPADV